MKENRAASHPLATVLSTAAALGVLMMGCSEMVDVHEKRYTIIENRSDESIQLKFQQECSASLQECTDKIFEASVPPFETLDVNLGEWKGKRPGSANRTVYVSVRVKFLEVNKDLIVCTKDHGIVLPVGSQKKETSATYIFFEDSCGEGFSPTYVIMTAG